MIYALVIDYFLRFFALVVFAACLNAFALGDPADPGLRIFSPLPAFMRLRFFAIFPYNEFSGIIYLLFLNFL